MWMKTKASNQINSLCHWKVEENFSDFTKHLAKDLCEMNGIFDAKVKTAIHCSVVIRKHYTNKSFNLMFCRKNIRRHKWKAMLQRLISLYEFSIDSIKNKLDFL